MTRPDDELVADYPSPESAEPDSRDRAAPVADAAEQSVSANPSEQQPAAIRRGPEVGEWDALEQQIVVDLEDEYDH